jgi:hypothetical protein
MSDQDWVSSPPPPPPGGDFAPGEPPPGPTAPPLPWEDRARLGFLPALLETIKLLVTAPGEAYRRTREKGDYVSPLLFALIIGWAMAIVGQIWSTLFQSTWISMMPAEFREQFGAMMATSVVGFVMTAIFAPILIVIVLFIWSAIVHLFLSLVSGTSGSAAGFEGTFRGVSYAQVASLAQVVPVVGGMIALVWGIVLEVIGLATLHKTTTGKAAAGVLLPVALCCLCVIAAAVLFGAAIMAAIASQQ